MKRINVGYDGQMYSVGEADLEELKARILAAAQGEPTWVRVQYGEGRPQPAEILLGPGIAVSLMPVPGPED